MTRADFFTGIVLILLGLGVTIESLRMPTLEHLGVNPYTVPGIVPGLLGVVIGGLGAVLLARAARAGGWRVVDRERAEARGDGSRRRLWVTLLLTLGYAAGLIGHMPFWLATFIFVFLFVAWFEWQSDLSNARKLRRVAAAGLLAAAVSATVTAVFQYVFLVRLP